MPRRPAPAPDPTAPRREPRQARSRDRVERILSTAAAMVDTSGVESVTTNALAELAGIPVGTIYQFFPNRESVLLALLERQLQELDHRFGPLIYGATERAPLPDLIAAVIDELSHAYVEIPALATLVQTLRGDPRYAVIADANNRAIAGWIEAVVRRRAPAMKPARARAIATATVEAADGVLMGWLRLLRLGQPAPATALLAELQLLLTSYLTTAIRSKT